MYDGIFVGQKLNPGNIGERWKVEEVVRACAERAVPIRIGVNAGSLEKELLEEYGHPTAEAMVASALAHVRILEELDYREIKVSLKASDVQRTVTAYRLLAEQVDYPLQQHLRKEARALLKEVRLGWEILKSLELRERGPVFISCPTCGRCEIDLIEIAEEVERRLHNLPMRLSIAVMGCVVNGPGEAREADLGIAGGKGQGLLFRKGKVVRKVAQSELADALVEEALALAGDRRS